MYFILKTIYLLVPLTRKFKNVDKSEGNVLFLGLFGNYIYDNISSVRVLNISLNNLVLIHFLDFDWKGGKL